MCGCCPCENRGEPRSATQWHHHAFSKFAVIIDRPPYYPLHSPCSGLWLLLVSMMISTWSTTCWAAPAEFSAEQLSRIWQQEFSVPSADLAPSTFHSAKAVPKAGVSAQSGRPHPAVARIIVPETGAVSYGSGTLIDVRDNFGMVITNWHVVRDATGTIEVVFPDGFSSKARALKVDADWDLAALVIWRPRIEPVTIADDAPRPGDALTICGYGQGSYRSATGRCTQYYAPRLDFPRHMVELDVEARQGDSGGPIFNQHGELAGVLFGAGQGTTLGSFGGRVETFLATLAPDIGRATESLAEQQSPNNPSEPEHLNNCFCAENPVARQSAMLQPHAEAENSLEPSSDEVADEGNEGWPSQPSVPVAETQQANSDWQPVARRENLFDQVKTVLAAIGLLAIVVQMLRVAR